MINEGERIPAGMGELTASMIKINLRMTKMSKLKPVKGYVQSAPSIAHLNMIRFTFSIL